MAIGHDWLDSVEPELVGELRCSGCARLGAEVARANRPRCGLRSFDVHDPAETVCADHTALTAKPGRQPVGPVLAVRPGALEVLAPSPDAREVRDHLLDLLEATEARDAAELSLRQRLAIWQVRELGERRAHVHVDRIEGRILAPPVASSPLEAELVASLAGDELRIDAEHGSFVESFSVPGRLLILSSFFLGALAFWWTFDLQVDSELFGNASRIFVSILPAAVVVGLYLRLGIAAFRRLGIPFRARS